MSDWRYPPAHRRTGVCHDVATMPLVLDRAAPGCDCYVLRLPQISKDVQQSWSYQGSMRSFQWNDGGVVKLRTGFEAHRSPDEFFALIEAGSSKGVYRPSSYASFFHNSFFCPRPTGAARRAMSWTIPGAWEVVLLPRGDYAGKWYKYDLRSAYLWALFAGLPDPDTYAHTEKIHLTREGCYMMESGGTLGAPYPYNRPGVWPILRSEIDAYNICGTVHYGVTWTRNLSPDPMLKHIMQWPFWKHVARSFWGRWAAVAPLKCTTWKNATQVKTWDMPSAQANPIWAHTILSRVRGRLHDITKLGTVARVYVDNVITSSPLPTGDAVGDWRLEQEYDGIRIKNLHVISNLNKGLAHYVASAA